MIGIRNTFYSMQDSKRSFSSSSSFHAPDKTSLPITNRGTNKEDHEKESYCEENDEQKEFGSRVDCKKEVNIQETSWSHKIATSRIASPESI